MKRRSTSSKTKVDPLADLIASEQPKEDEFPDGYVHFSCIPRFGTHVVDGELTVTGRSYEITRKGTRVDIKDMEALKSLKRKFYCPRDEREYEIPPIGITSL